MESMKFPFLTCSVTAHYGCHKKPRDKNNAKEHGKVVTRIQNLGWEWCLHIIVRGADHSVAIFIEATAFVCWCFCFELHGIVHRFRRRNSKRPLCNGRLFGIGILKLWAGIIRCAFRMNPTCLLTMGGAHKETILEDDRTCIMLGIVVLASTVAS